MDKQRRRATLRYYGHMPTRPGTGRPADKKGKYVRISIPAYEKIKAAAEKAEKKEDRSFIRTLDRLLKV